MKKKAPSEHGEFRSIHSSLFDDLDFQRLSPLAKLLFLTLKSQLGQYGISVLYPEILPRIIGESAGRIEEAFREIEQPKPGRAHGWVVREEHLVWIVNGLRFEPWADLAQQNHRLGARRFAATLPQLEIVKRFIDYYGLGGDGGGTLPPTIGRVEGSTETESETKTESKAETETELDAAFLQDFYTGASPERRADVRNQLARLRSLGGVPFKGTVVRPTSQRHLDQAIRRTRADTLRDPDKAIAVLLMKLQNPETDSLGRTVTEAASENLKAEDRRIDETFAAWEREHPDRAREFRADAEAKIPGDDTAAVVQREAFFRQSIMRDIEAERGAA